MVAVSLFLMVAAVLFNRGSASVPEEIAATAAEAVEKKALVCREGLSLLLDQDPPAIWKQLGSYYDENRVGLYLWEQDSLVFWNNAQIPLKKDLSVFDSSQGLVRLSKGYYMYLRETRAGKTALALALLKPAYQIRNNYLSSDFRPWTGIPAEIRLDTNRAGAYPVLLNGEWLFSIKVREPVYYNAGADQTCSLVFFAGFLLFLLSGLMYVRVQPVPFRVAAAILAALLLRWCMLSLKWPDFLYRTDLYDLQLFGNARSFHSGYLGDIFLNAFTALFMAAVIHLYVLPVQRKRWHRGAYIGLVMALLYLVYDQFNQTAVSLINNSTLSFDFLSIFAMKYQAFVGLSGLALYSLALFLLVVKSLSFFTPGSGGAAVKWLTLYTLVCVLQQQLGDMPGLIGNFWLLPYAAVILLVWSRYRSMPALALGIQIIAMSLVTSHIFNVFIERNQAQDLDILSIKLSEKQDALLENEFAGIPEKMARDRSLINLLEILSDIPDAEKDAEMLLRQKYFGGYFDRYNLEFSLFDKNCHPLLEVRQPVLLNEGFFEDQILYHSDSTVTEGLFFVKSYRKNALYIAKIPLNEKRLFVLMEPRQFEELGSFPDLLQDQSQQKPEKLKGFSHAVYRSGQLTGHYGEFNYPFSFPDSTVLARSEESFVHRYYQTDEDTEVIISQKARSWSYFFTFNSYLLLLFAMLTYVCYITYSAVLTDHFTSPTLTRRIQTIIVLLLLLAMSAVGITSGGLVKRQFERNNKKQLEEKTRIIINELTAQFRPDQFFEPSRKELINLKLEEYSRLFNTPISLFDGKGQLFNTSEPKLYELGLAAPLVNPRAYWKLNSNLSSSESVTDRAGSLRYLSHYTPLFDAGKQLVGFINLPYFARQSDLTNELSGIISTLINVYVILFVISILTGLILSGLITQPLRLIKQQLSHVTLGGQNEKIVWQSNDEIGKLVSEYNQMLVKLEQSAELLAQSERESAWREMAKQVAHEIKNPLTPMKLNLQHMQHLMKANPENFRESFERSSAGIIEQIDALANIANEFSHFAKLPGARLGKINLSEIIASAVLLFENQEHILNTITEKEILVKGDSEQCLRVFNNILKNACQAVEEVAEPEIVIACHRREHVIIVSITDNGVGISEALKPRIFTPNFTTKSTGSGLGLAMVRNIMIGFEGSVSFSSSEGEGTTFYLEFRTP
jgi:two-component system nitrogen regulation sensor histidine kinase NtrY